MPIQVVIAVVVIVIILVLVVRVVVLDTKAEKVIAQFLAISPYDLDAQLNHRRNGDGKKYIQRQLDKKLQEWAGSLPDIKFGSELRLAERKFQKIRSAAVRLGLDVGKHIFDYY